MAEGVRLALVSNRGPFHLQLSALQTKLTWNWTSVFSQLRTSRLAVFREFCWSFVPLLQGLLSVTSVFILFLTVADFGCQRLQHTKQSLLIRIQ